MCQSFRTTISFRGEAKKLVSLLAGQQKSAVINAVLAEAIHSGLILKHLASYYTEDELKKIYDPNVPLSPMTKKSDLRLTTKSQNCYDSSKDTRNIETEKLSLSKKTNTPQGINDGYDF